MKQMKETPRTAAKQIALAVQKPQSLQNAPLKAEINDLLQNGCQHVSIHQLTLAIKELGYKFDRRMDCRGNARYITGPRAGSSYPTLNLYTVQIDDGKSAFHFESRRDDNFNAFQALRSKYFAVSKNAIVGF